MSGSDSDLEFESADEGGINEDISDIDLSDLEDKKDETLSNEVEKKEIISFRESKIKEEASVMHEQAEIDDPKKEINLKKQDVATNKVEGDDKIDDSKIEINLKEQDVATNKVEGDDEIEEMLNHMGIDDTEVKQTTNKLHEKTHDRQVKTKEIELEAVKISQSNEKELENIKNERKIGWDEDELEINDDFIEETVQSTNNKVTSLMKEDKKENEEIQKQQTFSPPSQEPPKKVNTGWSWSSFGTNFISTAVGSLNTVLETVEATIGAPDPAELAAKSKVEQSSSKANFSKDDKLIEQNENLNDWNKDEGDSEWFSMPQLDKITTTSLNLLETVGKKTIEVINDKDPNFRNTRNFLSKVPATLVPIQSKPNLSQMLREAQQNESNVKLSSSVAVKPDMSRLEKQEKLTFSLFFDEYKGSAHLEALEMLSRQTSVKVEMIMLNKSNLNENKHKIDSLNQYFDSDRLSDENEFNEIETQKDFKLLINNKTKNFDPEHYEFLINEYAKRSNLKLVLDKVVGAFKTTSYAVKEIISIEELYNEAIKCFALVTSNIIELYHKAAEAILVEQQKTRKNTNSSKVNPLENADVLYNIRSVTILADDFSKKCKSISKDTKNTSLNANQVITDIYLEASNSSTYIGDAYLLFAPLFKSEILEKEVF